MTMVDSIKVYGKTKDAFGWPEDNEDGAVTNTGHANGTQASSAGMNNEVIVIWSRRVSCIFFIVWLQADQHAGSPQQLSKLERLAMDVFKSLDSSLYIYASDEKFAKLKPAALKIGE